MRFRSVTFLAAAALVAGCSASTEPVDSLDVQLAVEPTAFRIGDAALLQITLSNLTADTIRLHNAQCNAWFQVYDDTDSVVTRIASCRAGEPVDVYLPGEQRLIQVTWHGESGVLDNVNGSRGEFLLAGHYRVEAVLRVVSNSRRSAVLRRSDPATVQLLPPD